MQTKKTVLSVGAAVLAIAGIILLPHLQLATVSADTSAASSTPVLSTSSGNVTNFSFSPNPLVSGQDVTISADVQGVASSSADVQLDYTIYSSSLSIAKQGTISGTIPAANDQTTFTQTTNVDLTPGTYTGNVVLWNSDHTQNLGSFNIPSFTVIAADQNTSTSTNSTSTSTDNTATSTDNGNNNNGNDNSMSSTTQDRIDFLRTNIAAYQSQINAWQIELDMLVGSSTDNGGNNNGGTTGASSLTPSSGTYTMNGSVDFNGRNFGREEDITIMRDGSVIGHAHADGGGNFSTGSMSVPGTAGTYTYTFTGANSGIMQSATVTVQ